MVESVLSWKVVADITYTVDLNHLNKGFIMHKRNLADLNLFLSRRKDITVVFINIPQMSSEFSFIPRSERTKLPFQWIPIWIFELLAYGEFLLACNNTSNILSRKSHALIIQWKGAWFTIIRMAISRLQSLVWRSTNCETEVEHLANCRRYLVRLERLLFLIISANFCSNNLKI